KTDCSALLPVTRTLAALTTTTLSPQSTCGVHCGLCLPRSRVAIRTARRPSTTPSASISTQSFFTSDGLREGVVFSMDLPGPVVLRARVIPESPCAVKGFHSRYHNTTSKCCASVLGGVKFYW